MLDDFLTETPIIPIEISYLLIIIPLAYFVVMYCLYAYYWISNFITKIQIILSIKSIQKSLDKIRLRKIQKHLSEINAKCKCGSGLRYKYCCLDKKEEK